MRQRTDSDRDWLIPSTVMTASLGLAAMLLMPLAGYAHTPPYWGSFSNWLGYSFMGACLFLAVQVIRMMVAGKPNPIAVLKKAAIQNASLYATYAVGMLLAGIDLLFFMWIKPELTTVSPFWTDRFLADLDYRIFGFDPWRFFEGLDLTGMAWTYNFFWALSLVWALLWLFLRPRSIERSTSILSYFALWSVFGPVGQLLFSAAGPIFYARIGLGNRFEPMMENIPDVTHRVSNYLWALHSEHRLDFAAGISAMPSLHIATVTWTVLAFATLKSRLTPVMLAFALYIYAGSVALGWHYAVDGVVGVLGAIGCHYACAHYLRVRAKTMIRSLPEMAKA